MNYTDTADNPATGIVWSPGPLPGTVWVLPESGAPASTARVVKLDRKAKRWEELDAREVDRQKARNGSRLTSASGFVYIVGPDDGDLWRAAQRRAFNDGRGMPAKDWHAALGFVPAERVQCFEANDQPTLLDLTA